MTNTIDIEQLKENTDLRYYIHALIVEDGRSYPATLKWWRLRCPFHNDNTPSLGVTKDYFRCFGCGASGDLIDFVMAWERKSFTQVVEMLGVNIPLGTRAKRQAPLPKLAEAPAREWQAQARAVIDTASFNLWGDSGQKALRYLTVERGLPDWVVAEANLGYVPGHYKQWVDIQGLSVPCGITIPWVADGEVWGIKVRRSGGEAKYQQVAGGSVAKSLYWADHLAPGKGALIVEGEFNCLAAWAMCNEDKYTPVSLGSAGGSLDMRWIARLAGCSPIVAVFDKDSAGEAGAARLHSLASRVRLAQVEGEKDLNDLLVRRGYPALWKFLQGVMA